MLRFAHQIVKKDVALPLHVAFNVGPGGWVLIVHVLIFAFQFANLNQLAIANLKEMERESSTRHGRRRRRRSRHGDVQELSSEREMYA